MLTYIRITGVVLHANGKKMICRNTIDSRLDIAFDALTPQVFTAHPSFFFMFPFTEQYVKAHNYLLTHTQF
jgi:hypothetical protein